jgi:hypothetical protein
MSTIPAFISDEGIARHEANIHQLRMKLLDWFVRTTPLPNYTPSTIEFLEYNDQGVEVLSKAEWIRRARMQAPC